MTAKVKTTVLPAGPTKRVWVNKHHLPQFGGSSPTAPVWEVECEGQRYSGYDFFILGWSHGGRDMTSPDGPHLWAETTTEVIIYTAAEEAA